MRDYRSTIPVKIAADVFVSGLKLDLANSEFTSLSDAASLGL
jgi:hypothetical protein